eukprot:scaffold22717_cov211-Cylindrotheca_fusiformis.AAC.1
MAPTNNSADDLVSYQRGHTKKSVAVEPEETTNEYVLGVAFWTFLLFLLTEAVFAVIAGSQAMLEDAEAMSVDALTYLFNLLAERVKNRPYTEYEKSLAPEVLDYRRERLRLYLELIPPLISVVTLIVVTAFATSDALESLADPESEGEVVNVNLMILFSAGNMVLDIVNVCCFAKANQAFGLSTVKREPLSHSARSAQKMEMEGLLTKENGHSIRTPSGDSRDLEEETGINLNMCSAWTHIMADTLRSTAVLIAACISFFVESVSGATADSMATLVVSVIILVSLLPLLRGLYETGCKIVALRAEAPTLSV